MCSKRELHCSKLAIDNAQVSTMQPLQKLLLVGRDSAIGIHADLFLGPLGLKFDFKVLPIAKL